MTDRRVIEPMEVRRVRNGGGSRIEPPMDESWDNDTKLSWHAGVLLADTGLRLTLSVGAYKVKRFGRWVVPNGYWTINMAGASHSAFTFNQAWTWINGVSAGYEATKRLERA